MKSLTVWALLAACVALPHSVLAIEAAPSEIMVTGTGQAFAKSDYGTMMIGVRALSPQAAEATGIAAATKKAIIKALRDLGIAEADLATLGYSVSPEWEYNERGVKGKMTGYAATHTIRVKVRDIQLLGQVVDAAMGAGANDVGSVEFKAADEDSAQHTALSQAVRSARTRAEIMAEASGGRLGRLIELTMDGAVRARGGVLNEVLGVERMVKYAIDTTEFNPGDRAIKITVLGRWEFLAGRK